MVDQARCPQYWATFSVRGSAGTYDVGVDDPVRGTWTCSCKAWIFGGRTTCKHIERVRAHGCLGGGPNSLGSAGIEITGSNPMRASASTRRRCACGQLMRVPVLRMQIRGHWIVQIDSGGGPYTYASTRAWRVGDVVNVGGRPGTVVAIGSDYLGELKVIGMRAA
jgi:hypothetical protein